MATRLRRLKIDQFRDVRPGTELRFGDGWNVLVGRNGSGKTTLLNLISMVLRDDLSPLRGEAFAIEYELGFEDGISTVVRAVNSLRPDISGGMRREFGAAVSIAMLDASGRPGMEWRTSAERSAETGGVQSARDVFDSEPLIHSRYRPVLSRDGSSRTIELLGVEGRSLGRNGECYRMDEGVSTFEVLTGSVGNHRVGLPSRSIAVSTPRILRTVTTQTLVGHFVPTELVVRMMRQLSGPRASIEFDLGGDETLDRCVRLLGRGRVVVVATSTTTDEGAGSGPSFGNFRFFSQQGVSPLVPHEHWSFGQKRLLTFFWYLACNPDVVVADELVNGLHWDWIDACVDAIGTRQVFVSAQNPLLLDHLGFDSEDAVAHGFVLCRSAPVGEGRSETVWTHPDAAQSAEFFRSYQNGVMQVHDILRTQGLW
jgi:energy-coupling factor transporter ATP-binding protein EcfA2